MIPLKIKKTKPHAITPQYANPGDAGMDLFSAEDYLIKSGERCLISTGIQTEFPTGYELQIRPRSGLALKHGISIVNTPGTVDAGYRGEIGIILINHGKEEFKINQGDKIAQAVLNKIEIATIEESDNLSDTQRGTGGFGSTGIKS
jgi:dUTP pyrophosphatase